jgi:hypothetical protein
MKISHNSKLWLKAIEWTFIWLSIMVIVVYGAIQVILTYPTIFLLFIVSVFLVSAVCSVKGIFFES